MAYKTPGVYIVEQNAFPNSVVEVETAVPAFIGYTAKADNKGTPLKGKPWRITSMADFINYYGGMPEFEFSITQPAAPVAGADGTIPPAPTPDFTIGDKSYLVTQTGGRYLMYQSMLLFFQNGGGPCYIVSVGNFKATLAANDLTNGIMALKKEQSPTMLVIPDAISLSMGDCISVQQAALQHCGMDMKNRIAILDIYNGFKERTDPPSDCVSDFRDKLGTNYLNYGTAYYPWVNATVVQDTDIDYTLISDAASQTLLQGLLKTDMGVDGTPPTDAMALKNFNGKLAAISAIGQTIDQFKAAAPATDPIASMTPAQLQVAFAASITAVHQLLTNFSPLYVVVMAALRQKLNLLPPSAAMAGVYTAVDNARGVWKAPANVSLQSVTGPVLNISQEEQEDLNVTTAGKSINAIRSFIGEGTLVWGARTLDGNSLDWRYVNVRRTMIMLEESLRLATKAYVFEPNVANTWITIKSMIRNFLTSIWKRGGLAGASPDDAFSIFCGLGETMTADDILEGLLNVTVLVALSRPAEFIEITFQQQMQKS